MALEFWKNREKKELNEDLFSKQTDQGGSSLGSHVLKTEETESL